MNDPYDLDVSIKDSEHVRQAGLCYVGGSRSVYIIQNNFYDVCKNPRNKIQLQHSKRKMNSKACYYNLYQRSSSANIWMQAPCSSTYSQLRKYGIEKAVVIDAEDTDIIVLDKYVAHHVKGNLHLKRKGAINITAKKSYVEYMLMS